MKKFHYIDIMRGIAIMAVIAMHCIFFKNEGGIILTIAKFGQMGVQLFFVASALTLCLSMEHRGFDRKKEYYLRRYFRIAPMYYVGLILYFIISMIRYYNGLPGNYELYTFFGILTNVFLVHGFVPEFNNNLVFGGWSIGTEVAFYLVFPYLFIRLKDKSVSYISRVIVIYSTFIVFMTMGVCYIYDDFLVSNNGFLYYNLFNQLPVFLWGIMLYCLIKRGKISPKKHFAGMIVGLGGFFYFWYSSIPLAFYFVPLFMGMVFFCFGAILSRINFRIKILEKIGKMSYSIYIVHFIFCWFLFPILDASLLLSYNATIRFLLNFFTTLCLSYMLSSVTRKYIEKPFMDYGNAIIKRMTGTKAAEENKVVDKEVAARII